MKRVGALLLFLDRAVPAILAAVEALIERFAFGWRRLVVGRNIFDFVIAGIGLAPTSGNLSVRRSLHDLRGLRLLAFAPSIRWAAALTAAKPGKSSMNGSRRLSNWSSA